MPPRAPHPLRPAMPLRAALSVTVWMAAALPLALSGSGPAAAQQADGPAPAAIPRTVETTRPDIQPLPQWTSTTVNDFAGLLTPDDARALDGELTRLQQETGIEGTVVTLPDRATYGGTDGLQPFATRLFNHWGVGDVARNNGFMVLVLRDDREARIELGSAYPGDADIPAQDIMRNVILPDMREGTPSAAIRKGTEAIIQIIAEPYASGRQIPRSATGRGWRDMAGGAIAVLILTFAGVNILRGIRRRKRCPQCGKWDLQKQHEPVRQNLPDGGWRTSESNQIRRCPACGWQAATLVAAPFVTLYGPDGQMRSRNQNPKAARVSRGGSGFGGGSSRGGGASGRW